MAACLALKGHSVSLLNRSRDRIEPIVQTGGIMVSGELNGLARLRVVTTNAELALRGAQVIMVAMPATGHRWVAETLAPHLRRGQVIVLNPGRTGGALELTSVLSQLGAEPVTVAETATLLVASRLIGPGQVHIFGMKKRVRVAAMPALETDRVTGLLRQPFPQFRRAGSVLETSLSNIGAIFHPIPTLFNAARIEDPDVSFEYYRQGVSPAVARVMAAVDRERMEIAAGLGVRVPSATQWLASTYGVAADDLSDALRHNPAYRGIEAPDTLEHRYLLEDIPTGLVPMADLGDLLGVPTPTIRRIVDIAGIMLGVDFWASGRTLARMGLDGLTADDLRGLVHTGDREGLVI